MFNGVPLEETIISFDPFCQFYKFKHEDGDTEEFNAEEFAKYKIDNGPSKF